MTFSLLLSCFVLIIPVFGKAINYWESLALYGGILILFLYSFFYPSPRRLTKKFLIFQATLILLSFLSAIFSQNIGYSYYGFFHFIFSLIILNLCLTYLNTEKLSKYILYFSIFYASIFLLNKFNILTLSLDPSYDNFIVQIWGHSYLADFLIFSLPYLLYQIFYSSPIFTSKKYFYYFSLLFISATTILTNSRSAIVALTTGTLFLFLPKIPKHLRAIFVLLMVTCTIFLNYQFFSQNRNLKSLDGKRIEYWQQATTAFLNRPLLGHGPFNFFYINKKYQSAPFTNTNYAHNSFLEYLCLNGLLFTLIIFVAISYSLLYQYRHHPLSFVIGLTALTNSLLDPSWNSLGIFCLSLFFIFNNNPDIVSSSLKPKKNPLLKLIVLVFASLFFLSKTASDYLFVNNQLLPSLYADPFNLNPRMALLPDFIPSTSFMYQHDSHLYQQLINITPLPQSEIYYYQLFSLAPKENINEYQQLAAYYLSSNNSQKLNDLLSLANQNLNQQNFPASETLPLAKIAYNFAIQEWQNQQFSLAINHLRIALNFSQGWSHFQIELANAYWHTDQKDLAIDLLKNQCPKAIYSTAHCLDYLDKNSNNFLLPGTDGFIKSINGINP